MKYALFAALLLLCTWASFAQTEPSPAAEKTSFEMKFEGMVAVSFGSDTFGVNVGGPSLKYRISPNFKIGAGAFPSLIVQDEKAMPRLAVSPIIEYKKWMFITPYYGYDTKNRQIWTFGIGYRFR
jgi:hypothetical protein